MIFSHVASPFVVFRSGYLMIPAANAAYPLLLWLFVLGLAPVLVVLLGLLSVVSQGETQIWLGDLRVVWCGVFVLCFEVDCCMYMTTVSCTYTIFEHASHSVRTEP